jgi:K+-sensing histidine kinase KdpD
MAINSQIDLYNKKLEKNKLDKQDTKILLVNIKEKIKKLNTLLETFLVLSRIENNIEKLNKKRINFSDYLKKYVKDYIENNEIIKNI